jgi:hypothetical protein
MVFQEFFFVPAFYDQVMVAQWPAEKFLRLLRVIKF